MRRTRIERKPTPHRLVALGFSCAVAFMFMSPKASAEPSEGRAQARAHFDQGVALARRRAYAEALTEFQRAYEIAPHFSVLYNIGQALIALGRPTEAVGALDRYIEGAGSALDPQRRAEVNAAIESELAKTGSIEVTVDREGALVTIDDKAYGRAPLPLPVRVDSGAHHVLAVLESGERREANIEARAQQVSHAELTFGTEAPAPVPALAPAPAPAPAPPPTAAAASAPAPARVPASVTWPRSASEPPTSSGHHEVQQTLGYVVGAAGVALTGAAAAHFLWNRARYRDWQSRYSTYYSDPSEQNRQSANDLARSVSNASPVTLGLAIAAGVALGTSTVLLLTSSDSVTATGGARGGGPFMTLRGAF
jgi:tetratricopeptide (TPR) repeat protein